MKKHLKIYRQVLRIKCKPHIKTLEREMITRCKAIRNLYRKNKFAKKDLPATIIAAVNNKKYKIDKCQKLEKPIAQQLQGKLLKLGPIGSHNGINNIGHCAENITANFLMTKKRVKRLEDIKFTNAYRPRTARVVKRCPNCIKIFGQ